MDDHQSKIVSESVSDEKPVARKILKPDLRFLLTVFAFSVNEGQSPTFAF